ncbi:MAG: D-alanine--D-alanine ligase, partial [Alphaproteobacteria bacterium]
SEVLARFGPVARAALAPFVVLNAGGIDERLSQAEAALRDGRIRLPLVVKPDIGCRGAGVKRVSDEAALRSLLPAYPQTAPVVLQNLVAAPGEVGIFHVRHPDEPRGRIVSMTLKYFPRVKGDGRRTLRRLIADDPRAGRLAHLYHPRLRPRLDEIVPAGEIVWLTRVGAHSKGAIFRDGRPWITPALEQRIDEIARDIDGFFIGRFDVRFSDFKALCAGRDITVIEVNGAGGEATHIWDSRFTLWRAWRDLARQYAMLFRVGRANVRRGARLPGYGEFWHAWRREARLVARYPFPD